MLTAEEMDIVGLCPETRFKRRTSNISQALRAVCARPDPIDKSSVEVRPIRNEAELDQVHRIVYDAYLERGYCQERPDGRLIHYPHLDRIAETTVLVVVADGEIIGTNSWTLDGPNGLPEDSDFNMECDAIRGEGKRLAAAWRLATKSSWRSERKVVMELIRKTVVGAFIGSGIDTALMTFNPRHERIYQQLLNMKTIARSENTRGLKNAPAVLMRLDREAVPERWLGSVAV